MSLALALSRVERVTVMREGARFVPKRVKLESAYWDWDWEGRHSLAFVLFFA